MDAFICGICHNEFHDIVKFVDHKRDLGAYSCGLCGALYHTEAEVQQHANKDHFEKFPNEETLVEPAKEADFRADIESTTVTASQDIGETPVVSENADLTTEASIPQATTMTLDELGNVAFVPTAQGNLTILNNVQIVQSNISNQALVTLGSLPAESIGKTLLSFHSDNNQIPQNESCSVLENVSNKDSTNKFVLIEPQNSLEEQTIFKAISQHQESAADSATKGASQLEGIYACTLCQCFALAENDIINHLHTIHQISQATGTDDLHHLMTKLEPLPGALTSSTVQENTISTTQVENGTKDQTNSTLNISGNISQDTTLHLALETPSLTDKATTTERTTPKRKRGRPRKTDQKRSRLVDAESEQVQDGVSVHKAPICPEPGIDKLYHCQQCSRSFKKDHHLLRHKCMGQGDYVALSMKESSGGAVTSGSSQHELACEEDEEEPELDTDVTKDFKMYMPIDIPPWSRGGKGRGRGRGRGRRRVEKSMCIQSAEKRCEEEAGRDMNRQAITVYVKAAGNLEESASVDTSVNEKEDIHDPVVQEGKPKMNWRYDPRHIPVFSKEEDRLAFEENLNSVDLSCVEGLYTKHEVSQDTSSDKLKSTHGRECNELSVFLCNICKKVFKSLSHIHLHCLIHTDLKPFLCPQCPYRTNAKGNLYTHMRKHTGNFFQCSHCTFQCCSRSHLAEHEATHSNIRHKCKLCQNDYNTVKSLMNHVRKYHTGISGKKYLASFLSKSQQNIAVFHICHICNHKFKKQIDRDRHLFIHNIVNNASHCTLCDYTAARKSYLEAHHRKHRLVYVCCVCYSMFLSSVKLREHLQEHLSVPEENRNFLVAQAGKEMHPNNILLQITSETCTIRKMTDPGDINADKTSSTQSSCDENFKENEECFRKPANDNQDQDVSIHDITSVYSEISETSDAHTLSSLISDCNIPNSETGDICQLTIARRQKNSHSCATQGPSDLCDSMTSEITTSECNKTKEEFSNGSTRDTLFDASINQSWYLPEPDGTLAFNQYVNIPEELIEGQTNLNQEDIQNNDESLRIEEINKESLTEIEPGSETKQQSALDTIIALNYKPLTMDIYIKIRQSFGEFECDFCGRLFHVRLDLESHRLKHVEEKPYKCDKCPYSAGNKENLKSHQETNHEGRTYPCDQCGFVATSRTSLWHHRQKHLSNLLCQICQKIFTNIRNLRDHIVSVHPNVEKEEISKLLGKNRRPVGRLGRRSYKCPYCSKIFHRSSGDLQKHIWIHEGVKPYKCDVCSYSCRSRNNLNVHMLRHSAEKPHHCDECGKSYKSKTALRSHIKTHTQNSFVCDHCEYTTSETSEMQKHMKTHEQLQLYLCESCSFSSDNLNGIKVHYLQQHQETIMNEKSVIAISADSLELDFPEKMYKCLSCSCVFKTTAETRQHLEVQHGILLDNMDICGGTVGGIEAMPESVIIPISTPQDILQENSTNNSLPEEIQMVELQDADNESFPSLLKNLQLPNLAPVTKANESTSSALNIIHQVIHQEGMDSSGLTLHAIDGDRLIAVDPDTFIIQEDGQQLVVNGTDTQNQYVIQYVTQAATNSSDPSDITSDIIGESENELQFEIHCNKDIQLVANENVNQNVNETLASSSIIESHEP